MPDSEKQSQPFKAPSDLTVVAIGGAGKRLVNRLCDHEWFLNAYLSGNTRLRFEVIDTDTRESPDDKKRTKKIIDAIDKMKKEKRTELMGDISYKYICIPELASLDKVTDLTDTRVISQVKAAQNPIKTTVWWMHDPDSKWLYKNLQSIDPDIHSDFGGGVHRRRGISKAAFYKAITQSGDQQFPSFQGQGDVAIIVGLGGGTGSGMFIDLARFIRHNSGPERKIWLFALLPALTETKKEQLNAAIALTELEYLNLNRGNEDPLFNYIILSSLGPTGFTNGLEQIDDVVDFDNSFPYLFTNALSLPGSDAVNLIEAKAPYAGFIFADAHVIEYPIEELQKLKSEFESVIVDLGTIAKIRADLNNKVSEFINSINRRFPEQFEEKSEITQMDLSAVKKEIEKVSRIWECDVANLLEYKTPADISFFIKNQMDPRLRQFEKIDVYDDLSEYASKIKQYLESSSSKSFESESDKKLFNAAISSFAWISLFAEIQRRNGSIKDITTRKAIVTILRGNQDISEVQNSIATRKAEIDGEIQDLKKKQSQLIADEEKIESEKEKISQLIETKCNTLIKPINDYLDLKSRSQQILDSEDKFREKFDLMTNRLKELQLKSKEKKPPTFSRDAWLKEVPLGDVQRAVDELRDPVTKDQRERLKSIAQHLSDYYYYDYFLSIYNEKDPLLKKWIDYALGLIFGKGEKITKENIQKHKRLSQENIITYANSSRETIAVRAPFDIEFSQGFLSIEVQQKMNRVKEDIFKLLVNETQIDTADAQKMNPCFEKNDSNQIISEIKKELFITKIEKSDFTEKLNQIHKKQENITKQNKDMATEKTLFENLTLVVDDTFPLRQEYNNTLDEINRKMKSINEKKNLGIETVSRSYKTRVGEINPRVLSILSKKNSDLSALDISDDGEIEINKLKNQINQRIRDLFDVKKLGIRNSVINFETDVKKEAWHFETASLVVSSASHKISDWIINTLPTHKNAIKQEFNLHSSNEALVKAHNHSKPWEVAISFFVSASFLDNISPMISGGGYWEKYELGKNNLCHHVLLMQEGKYIVRDKLLRLEVGAEKANIEQYEKDDTNKGQAIRDVLELYKVKSLQDAVKK